MSVSPTEPRNPQTRNPKIENPSPLYLIQVIIRSGNNKRTFVALKRLTRVKKGKGEGTSALWMVLAAN